jgi:hypothetical protein
MFVQVINGKITGAAAARALASSGTPRRARVRRDACRPDILGGVVGFQAEGMFAQAFCFTSEMQAREAERLELPAELSAAFNEESQLTTEIPVLDLTEPWLYTATLTAGGGGR